jgi:hypothetical protein
MINVDDVLVVDEPLCDMIIYAVVFTYPDDPSSPVPSYFFTTRSLAESEAMRLNDALELECFSVSELPVFSIGLEEVGKMARS